MFMTLPTILIMIIFGSAIFYIVSLLIKSFKSSTPDLRQQESDIYESYFNQKINDKNSK